MNNKEYDYLIVGSGLFGAVCAHELTNAGKKCLVVEKRQHIGGNVYTEDIEGINVHKYGAHIFHTNDTDIWEYVNKFADFNRFTNSPLAISKGRLYNLPFNMNTFFQLWGVTSPSDAKRKIEEQIRIHGTKKANNLEEQAINMVGKDVYDLLIKEYTEKQWGRQAKDLPTFIIKRLPLRFTFDNNYFSDKHQGIPIGGYTQIITKMLQDVHVITGVDFLKNRGEWLDKAQKTIYTGPLDAYFNFNLGHLEYRSLHFENELLPIDNFQGNAVVNYIDKEIPYTRILEHKHFEFGKQPVTYISREYPKEFKLGQEPYYPINDIQNNLLADKYKKQVQNETDVYFGGRLSEYRYYDMHQVIASALNLTTKIIKNDLE